MSKNSLCTQNNITSGSPQDKKQQTNLYLISKLYFFTEDSLKHHNKLPLPDVDSGAWHTCPKRVSKLKKMYY